MLLLSSHSSTHQNRESEGSGKTSSDDVADDSDLAFTTIGSLFGPATANLTSPTSRSAGGGAGGFTIDLSKSAPSPLQTSGALTSASPAKGKTAAAPTSAASALGGEGIKFDLPPLVKTGKDGVGEIKMPALPLKANFKKKEKEFRVSTLSPGLYAWDARSLTHTFII